MVVLLVAPYVTGIYRSCQVICSLKIWCCGAWRGQFEDENSEVFHLTPAFGCVFLRLDGMVVQESTFTRFQLYVK